MALIVQDDVPVEGANGYVSLAEFKAFCQETLKDVSGKADAALEAAIVAASMHADLRFAYKGYRKSETQLLEFPREDLWDDRGDRVVGVPYHFKRGVMEYAYRALSLPLWADPEVDSTGLTVKRREEEVGPIKEKVEYDAYSGGTLPTYPVADRLIQLRGIVLGAPSGGSIGSASVGLG